MRRLRRHLTHHAVAYVALFAALGGTASAAVVISSNSQVGPGVIAGSAAPAGTTKNVIAGTIGPSDLVDYAFTMPRIALNAVDSARIVDGAVRAADLAGGTVTERKLGPEVQQRLDIALSPPDATNVDFGGVRLFAYCRPVSGTVKLQLKLANVAQTGTTTVSATWLRGQSGAPVTPALAAGSSTFPASFTILDDPGPLDGQGELTWHNDTGTGSGVFHYTVDSTHCSVAGVLFQGATA
jgi:hypothetical protein